MAIRPAGSGRPSTISVSGQCVFPEFCRLAVNRESRLIAEEMMQTPIGQLSERTWTRSTAADLRRFLIRGIEEHVERRLQTAPLLEAL